MVTDMEYYVFFGIIVLVIILFFWNGYLLHKKEEKAFIQYLRDNYSNYPLKKNTVEGSNRIKNSFRFCKDKTFSIDDITWNDLNMDAIYHKIDCTQSAAGEEYLYTLLRQPKRLKKHWSRFENTVSHFQDKEEERIKFQVLLRKLGSTGEFSLHQYLEFFDTLNMNSNWFIYLRNLAIIVSICLIPIVSSIGLLSTIFFICLNIGLYLRDKNTIEPYYVSIAYLTRLFRITKEISACSLVFDPEGKEILVKAAKDFQAFCKANNFPAGIVPTPNSDP